MTGHALMRRSQTAAGHTWTDIDAAMTWLTGIYAERPPQDLHDGQPAYHSLETRITGTRESLSHGDDTVWMYYARNGALVSYQVICCPPRYFHRHIPCPLTPS